MSVISETRERFLRAIVNTIAAERVIEIHFFHPIRQGGVESGVAVIAAALEGAATSSEGQPVPQSAPLDDAPVARGEIVFGDRAPVDESAAMLADGIPLGRIGHAESDASAENAADIEECETAAAEPAPPRYTVYSAKYRLVLKGPDRGRWEAQVVAEADAPLLTVETVVRGVQRRSGDLEVAELMKGEEVRVRVSLMMAAR